MWTGVLERLEKLARTEAKEALLALTEEDNTARILDCGCASGELTLQLGMQVGTNRLYGVDLIERSAQVARSRGIEALVANLNTGFPFQDASFHVVCGSQVLEHVVQTDTFIKEVHRVLKPGGYALISVPNLASAHNILFLLLGWQPWAADVSFEVYVGNPLNPRNLSQRESRQLGHVRLFTYPGFRELIEYHGFTVERLTGDGYYPFPIWISKLMSKIDPRHSVFLTAKVRK